MSAKEKKVIIKTIEELFKLLQISGDFDVVEKEDAIDLVLNTEDSGIVIGRHGDMLESLQLVCSLVVANATGAYKRVNLEVGEYKKNREEYLKTIAYEAKEKAILENHEVSLPMLKSWERRIVHVLLQDDKEVVSESEGMGKERTLVVKPR